MSNALDKNDGNVSIGGRTITNLRFADDSDAFTEEEQELQALVKSLDKTCTRYKTEISAEKTRLITNSATDIQREIKVNLEQLHAANTLEQLFQVNAQSRRFSQELHKQLQL